LRPEVVFLASSGQKESFHEESVYDVCCRGFRGVGWVFEQRFGFAIVGYRRDQRVDGFVQGGQRWNPNRHGRHERDRRNHGNGWKLGRSLG
jgi:hypothetical protein